MTSRELHRLVRKWQRRLGLERWQIEIVIDAAKWDAERDDDPRFAWCRHSVNYDSGEVWINPHLAPDWEFKKASETIVHELLHFTAREVEQASDLLERQVHRDVWTVFENQRTRSLEAMVDGLARRLVELEAELTPKPKRKPKPAARRSSASRRSR